MKQTLPTGIKLVSYIYLVNAVFYIFSLVLFYNTIVILGSEAGKLASTLVRFIFILVPLYLYLRLKKLKPDAWFLAVYFQVFFIINSALTLLEHNGYFHAIIRIAGRYSLVVYSRSEISVLFLSTILNALILLYLLRNRKLFS